MSGGPRRAERDSQPARSSALLVQSVRVLWLIALISHTPRRAFASASQGKTCACEQHTPCQYGPSHSSIR
eukprot:1546495-Rhodomonas_salina.2